MPSHAPWWVRRLQALLFAGIFVVPSLLGSLYYGVVASDQFVAEARMTVRNGDIPKLDAVGALTGLPSLTVVQDTQIVASFIQSRAMVERLQQRVGLDRIFAAPEADAIARFRLHQPLERLVDYWRGMTDVSIQVPSGILLVSVRAFRAADAKLLAEAVIAESETLVNAMNDRMRQDALQSAEVALVRARDRVGEARAALESERNATGLLDARQAGDGIDQLLLGLRSERLTLAQEIDSQLRSVAADAPQLRSLQVRLSALDAQIDDLAGRLTQAEPGQGFDKKPLSGVLTRFDQRALELGVAEKHFAAAFASLELARTLSEGKRVYLNAFVRPSLPEEAAHPRRLLLACAVTAASFLLWSAVAGTVSLARTRLA
ncbi:MAG: lipopolysaccharide biosynthesis protein [Alsobacter sp.]